MVVIGVCVGFSMCLFADLSMINTVRFSMAHCSCIKKKVVFGFTELLVLVLLFFLIRLSSLFLSLWFFI